MLFTMLLSIIDLRRENMFNPFNPSLFDFEHILCYLLMGACSKSRTEWQMVYEPSYLDQH